MTTIAIKTIRKAIAFNDAVTTALDKITASVGALRLELREKLQTKVRALIEAEYVTQHKVLAEPFELRAKLNKEHDELLACFKAESEVILATLFAVDSDDNKNERAARLYAINKRIEELRKLTF